MSDAPILTTPNPAGTGQPIVSDEQFMNWLIDMAPYLKQGASVWYAMDKAGLLSHKTVIYKKYRHNDWFAEKVDIYRAYVGELINMVGFKTIQNIFNRMNETDGKVGILSSEELQVWKTMAEKHRSAQPFFVTRVETSQADDSKLGKIIETLEKTDYDDVAKQARKQVVAANPSIQNQGQVGETSDVSAKPDAAPAPSGEGQSQV